jgi:LSD1 subclass zinc finger protein
MTDDMNAPELDKEKLSNELTCTGCGAILKFKPGTKNLVCTYCGAENVIEESTEIIEEIDYEKFITEKLDKEEKIEVVSVRCSACGASVTLDPNITSDQCPYCATNIVVKSGTTSNLLKPKSLLPFAVDRRKAAGLFNGWIKKLWFAPSDLKKADVGSEKLNGIYVPYWTYDARTQTWYTGQRGDYYYETETYTTTEDGQTVTKTRQVRRTRWTSVSGQVQNNFDDILVIASHSLPKKYTERLEPWNLSQLVPYNDKYLSGFRSESYQVDVPTGLNEAKEKMIPTIRTTINRDIGGDEQRILTMNTSYSDITFKHILLPIWISSYRFKDKVYRFLINGQTGEVQGERPYSALKIILTVLVVIAIIVGIILLVK